MYSGEVKHKTTAAVLLDHLLELFIFFLELDTLFVESRTDTGPFFVEFGGFLEMQTLVVDPQPSPPVQLLSVGLHVCWVERFRSRSMSVLQKTGNLGSTQV